MTCKLVTLATADHTCQAGRKSENRRKSKEIEGNKEGKQELLRYILSKILSRSTDLEMQNPNEDTEWNDALRRHGILPQKEGEVTEDQLIDMVEETVQRKTTGIKVVKAYEDMTLDELEELEDEEDERVLLQYRYENLCLIFEMSYSCMLPFLPY